MRVGHVLAAAVGFSAAVVLYEGRALLVDGARAWGVVASRLDPDRAGKLRARFEALPDNEKQRVVDEVRARRAGRREERAASGSGSR
jgi:hypothetical protein